MHQKPATFCRKKPLTCALSVIKKQNFQGNTHIQSQSVDAAKDAIILMQMQINTFFHGE
jgi:hypothetical protein